MTSTNGQQPDPAVAVAGVVLAIVHGRDADPVALEALPSPWKLVAKALVKRPGDQRQPWLATWLNGRPPDEATGLRAALDEAERLGLHLKASARPAPEGTGPDIDDSAILDVRPWPDPPAPEVYTGPIGEYALAVAPHTEADPLAILVHGLVFFGNAAGGSPHFMIGVTPHRANENAVVVGESALACKGTAKDIAVAPMEIADAEWYRACVKGGASSGEGIISAVRDPLYAKEPVKDKGRITGYQDVLKDEGVADKRLMLVESEFGGVLRALEREGNKLSSIIRQCWDGSNLSSLTKTALKATDPHISVIGHITSVELLELLSRNDTANGLSNRFLWIAARRSQSLPDGGQLIDPGPAGLVLRGALDAARCVGRVERSPEASRLWKQEYDRLRTVPPGMLGNVVSRAAPHVLRLALIYALADRCGVIGVEHLRAALALWDASARCAAFIFGERLGNPDSEKILDALKAAHPAGLLRSEITNNVFRGNIRAPRIDRALALLLASNLIRQVIDDATGGRPGTRFYACSPYGRNGERGKKAGGDQHSPPSSVSSVPYCA